MGLVRRQSDGQIKLLECPERLNTFFGTNVLTPTEPGRRFERIADPLGTLLRDGFAELEADTEYKALSAQANLSFDDFFEGKPGKFVHRLSYFVNRKTKKTTHHVMALLERNADGTIQMLECPNRLKEFFGDEALKPVEPGESFQNVLKPLGTILFLGLSGYRKRSGEEEPSNTEQSDASQDATDGEEVVTAEE